MRIPIVVIPIPGNKYQARVGEPFLSSVEGDTRDEAVQKLKEQITSFLGGGAEILQLEIPENEHPLKRFAGMLRDEPLFDEWQQAISDRCRELDADPDVP